jgi:hypothetical protein
MTIRGAAHALLGLVVGLAPLGCEPPMRPTEAPPPRPVGGDPPVAPVPSAKPHIEPRVVKLTESAETLIADVEVGGEGPGTVRLLLPKPTTVSKPAPFFSYAEKARAGRLEFAILWAGGLEGERDKLKKQAGDAELSFLPGLPNLGPAFLVGRFVVPTASGRRLPAPRWSS